MSAAELYNIADHLKIKTKLVCSGCGAPGQGSCGCGVAYVSAGERAEEAVKANPGKSNRAIAEESGVSYETIRRARKSTDTNVSDEKRTGRDGKARKQPKPTPPKPAPPIKTPDVKGRVAGVDIKVDPSLWQAFNERAQQERKSATALIADLITNVIEPGSVDLRADLPKSAQEKLDAAMRQHRRKLDAEHAERMRGVDEEVRKRVVAEGKVYVESMKEMEAKAWADQKHWREMVNDHKPPLTVEQFNLLRKCLHQSGIAAKPEDFDEAFDLIQTKKTPLAGLK
jgi:hypothetical protein